MNSYYDFKKVTELANNVYPLGDKRTRFYRWKRALLDIMEGYPLTDKEKKLIILSRIDECYRTLCEDIYFEDRKMDYVTFIDRIEERLGYNQLSNKNINKLKFIRMGEEESLLHYNQTFNDLVQEIKPEYRPPEQRLIAFYIQGLKEQKEVLFDYMFLREFKDLSEAMSVALHLHSAYRNMTSVNLEWLDKLDILHGDESDVQSELHLNELEIIDIGEDSVQQYNSRINELINGIKPQDKPTEKRLIYLYMNGLKRNREKVFRGVVFKEFKKLKDVMSFALKLDSNFIDLGLYNEDVEVIDPGNVNFSSTTSSKGKKSKKHRFYSKN